MSQQILICICGEKIYRTVKEGSVYTCSLHCRRKLLSQIGYVCSGCKLRLSGDKFHWFNDSRYHDGKRRFSFCLDCEKSINKEYKDNNYEKCKIAASKYRNKCLSGSGDEAILWYLKRRIGSYKKTSKELNIEYDINADYLLELFHNQNGKCYYTGEQMEWNNYGCGRGLQSPLTLSVDRLTPNLGYVKGNVVLCGHRTNTSKGARTENEFYVFCKTILDIKNNRESNL